MRAVYCYYRVRIEDADGLQQAFCALREELVRSHPGLRLSLLRRDDGSSASPSSPTPLDTWMEVHEQPAGGLDEASAQAVEAAARRHIARWIVGERHLERFRAVL